MKSLGLLVVAIAGLGLVASASAQQLETNDAGGALVHLVGGLENDPVPGVPVQISSVGTADVELRIKGAASSPFIFILGQVGATSTAVASGNPNTEYFDLDLGGFLYVIADGIGGAGLPIFSVLDQGGTADWTLPVGPQINGLSFAFQAVTLDAAVPFGLNFTAAVDYLGVSFSIALPMSVIGDDALMTYTPANPICFSNGVYNDLEVSTNGWLRFGTAATSNDLSESTVDMNNGHMGTVVQADPGVAMLWDDLHCGYHPNSNLTVLEVAPGIIQAQWNDFSFFGFPAANWGSMVLTIDSSGGVTLMTMDYTNTLVGAGNSRGIVGVTTGDPLATITVADLVTGGVVNVLGGNPGTNTIYEDFNATGPIDINGVVINVVDGACDGSFLTF